MNIIVNKYGVMIEADEFGKRKNAKNKLGYTNNYYKNLEKLKNKQNGNKDK